MCSSDLSFSSDESSVDIQIYHSQIRMPDNGEAIAMHPALSHPPKLSKGRITPNIIRDFENHAENFFMNAKHGVLDNKKVTRILGCFKDRLVNDWISVNCKRLHTLEFEQFMDEFCSHWLLKTWVEDLWNDILGSRLDPKLTTFEVWASKIQTLNVAL